MNLFVAAFILRSVAVSSLGLLILFALRNRSAATRHAVAAVTLISLMVLPFLHAKVPNKAITYLPQMSPRIPEVATRSAEASAPPVEESVRALPLEMIMAYGYLIITALLALRLLCALAYVAARVIRSKRETGSSIPLYTDSRAAVPMTAWLGRHVILLPESWRSWSAERLDTVLRHEQAHIRRNDWFVLILGQLSCAINWANPLAWVLLRKVRSLSEQAADDAVLRSGVPPTHYAQELLDISRSLKRQPSLVLHMADKAEIARRIEMVLNNKQRRGAASPAVLATVTILVATGAFAAASWAIMPGTLRGILFTQQSSSPYKDIREGRTTAGQASNGYTGTLSDGRKVKVLQVSKKVDGKVTAWSPDGTLLAGGDVIKHGYAKGEYLHFLMEMESTADPNDINGGLGSGPSLPGEPAGMTFAGGWVLPASSATKRQIISLIKPHDDAAHCSFSFGVSDRGWASLATFDPKNPSNNGGVRDFSLSAAKPPFPWEKWKEKKPLPGSSIRYTDTNEDMGDRRVVATLSDGTREVPSGNWSTEPNYHGAMKNLYFIQAPPAKVVRVDIEQRQSFAVELIGLALKPR